MSNTRHSPPIPVDLHAVATLAAGIASAVGMILIALSHFDVPVILGMTTVLCVGVLRLFNARIHLPRLTVGEHDRRFALVVLTVIVAALLARIDINPHLMGGQDQGLYTNMSEILLRDRGLFFADPLRPLLSEELRHVYDLSPLAGVTLADPKESLLSVVFYPLHPAWMAIVGFLLGEGNHTLSLLMFSALYLLGGYRLTHAVFGNRDTALLAAAFLAVNPALAFFSKFPASEMVSLAFAINGYLFLLRGWRAQQHRQQVLFLSISLLCFNAFLYARPQFILHVPFMTVLGVACLLPLWSVRQRLVTAGYLVSLLLAFVVSTVYYYSYQRLLFDAIVAFLTLMAKPHTLIAGAAAGVAVGALATVVLRRRPSGTRLGDYLAPRAALATGQLAPWAVPLALLASIPSIVALYQTGVLHPFVVFSIISPDQDPWIIRYHVLYRLMLFISPLGFLLLCVTPLSKIVWSGAAQLFAICAALAWMVVLLQPSVPYLYYYGRYLSGEMVPISLILCAAILMSSATGRRKWYAVIGAGVMLAYFSVYTFLQFGKREGENPAFAREIAEVVSDNDILFTTTMNSATLTPLRLYYGIKVFSYPQPRAGMLHEGLVIGQLQALTKKMGGKLYYISPTPSEETSHRLIKRLVFSNSFFTNGEHLQRAGIHIPTRLSTMFLPTQYETNTAEWYLYEIDGPSYSSPYCPKNNDLSQILRRSVLIDGFSSAEGHGRWSVGPKAYFECTLTPDGPAPGRIVVSAHAMVTELHAQRVRVSVNGAPAQEYSYSVRNSSQEIRLPIEVQPGERLRLDFEFPDAATPRELGVNNADPRRLAIGVKSIRFE